MSKCNDQTVLTGFTPPEPSTFGRSFSLSQKHKQFHIVHNIVLLCGFLVRKIGPELTSLANLPLFFSLPKAPVHSCISQL